MSRSILIYANCQGEELLLTGRILQSLAAVATFKWIPLHLVQDEDWQTRYGPDFWADVDAVWEQVETGASGANRARLRESIPPGVQIVTFPPLSATCLWPFSGFDPRSNADPDRYPWGDMVAASLAGQDLADDALFEEYMRISTARIPDMARRLRLDIARWKAADALSDVQAAAWVEQNFRRICLFHTAGHVTAAATTFLIQNLLGLTEMLGSSRSAAIAEVEPLLRHHGGQDWESVPIHPLVAARIGLEFYRPDAVYRWRAHEWTFRQYILRYIRWAPYLM